MLYAQLLRLFNKDTAYRILKAHIRLVGHLPLTRAVIRFNRRKNRVKLPRDVFNIHFDNPVGLGPGMDRNGQLYNTLSDYGFSFVEVGPVGRENVKEVITHLQSDPATPKIALMIDRDHLATFSLAYDFVDFFVLEIPDDQIQDVLDSVLDTRLSYEDYKPVLIRLMHDFPDGELAEVLSYCQLNGVDGAVVAKAANVAKVCALTRGRFPVIGYDGVRSAEKARELLDVGASLVEVTTGLVLDGPGIADSILNNLK
ncbi:MAG: hypothetical protein IJU63_05560 [Bacteroidales bacterium]|nr:hypothetical protein [Bacteroidales bacterium]